MSDVNVWLTPSSSIETKGNYPRLHFVYVNVTVCFTLTPLTASGVLKGFDPLLNLVLDGTIEYMRGKSSQVKTSSVCNE